MITYNCRIPQFTANTLQAASGGLMSGTGGGNITLVIFPGTNRSFIVSEIDMEGFEVASATGEWAIFRTITAAAVGALSTVITPQPLVSLGTNPSFSGSAGQGAFATTQATLAAAPIKSFGLNANGQRYFWRANPNLDNAIDVPGTATALLNGIVLCQIGGGAVHAVAGRVQIKEI